MLNYNNFTKNCFLVLAVLIFPLSILSPTSLWLPIVIFAVVLFLYNKNKKIIFEKPSKQEFLLYAFIAYAIISILWTNNFEFAAKKSGII